MKTLHHIILLFCTLLGFCACGHKPYPSPLIAADSLTNVHPDSAITLLKNLEDTMRNAPQATQMYYRLLCIKANDKAYIRHTSDSLILPVLHYYMEKNDKRHLAEAYYYAGRVYRDLGDAPQALGYFQKAITSLPESGQHSMRSKIYSQMGTLLAYQDIYDEAIKMFRESYKYDKMEKDSVGIIYTLRDIGNMYQGLGQLDSTLFYLKEANRLSMQIRHTEMFNMMQGQLASIYTDLQMYDSARIPLQNALRDVERPNKSGTYSIAAHFYDETKQTDSAAWYSNELLKFGNVYAKRTAYRRLLEHAIERNGTKQMLHYLHEHLRYIDSIQGLRRTETAYRMHSLYNYQLREKENLRLKAENQQKSLWIVIISSGFLLAVASFIAYRQYSQRKSLMLKQQLEKLREIEKENRKKIEFLERYNSHKEELNKGIARISLSENEEQKRQQEQRMELLNHILQQQVTEEEQEKQAQELLFSSDLYQALQERTNSARGEAYVTSNEWEPLKALIRPAYPKFFERLYSLCTPNENELHVCMLLKLRFRPIEIARLLQLKRESISSIRKRLYQKVTGNKGTPEMWDKIVHSL